MVANWSALDPPIGARWLPTRELVATLIGHDFYHAGEINHLRALLQGTDRWPYDDETRATP